MNFVLRIPREALPPRSEEIQGIEMRYEEVP
jgi:hypothetical protein